MGTRVGCVHVHRSKIQNYRGRISGPLLDRFDLHVEVPRLNYAELKNIDGTESSSTVRERVMAARRRQWTRLGPAKTNAEMTARETKVHGELTPRGESLLHLSLIHISEPTRLGMISY